MNEQRLFDLHQAARLEGLGLAYARTYSPEPRPRDPRRLLAESAEREAAIRLLLEGHAVERTPGHNDRYDLLVDDRLRVEVKAARWTRTRGNRGRYQAHIHNRADVVCWLLANTGQWFVVPVDALSPRRCIAIWSYDARDYSGIWSEYLGAWGLIDDLVHEVKAGGRTFAHQLALDLEVG